MGAPDQHRSPTGALSKSCGGRWSLRPPCPLPLPPIFFSSRRRHMRCSRDWSSDVCSSDLTTPNPSVVGQAVTLSTTVTALAPALGLPTGTVTFRDGATVLGTVTLVNGSASLVTSTLTVGEIGRASCRGRG